MGNRLKKGRAPPSVHCPAMVSKKVTKQSDQSAEITEEAVVTVMKRRSCVHFDKRFNLDKLLKAMKSCQRIKCGECKEGVHVKRASIWKNGFSAKKAIWVCLECGYSVCGEPSEPQSHVVRHIKLTRHLLVIQCENPKLRWCVPCNSLLSFEKEENGEKKDLLLEVVKLIKERYSNTSSASVETDGSYSGIMLQGSVSSGIEAIDGYALRGLVNLGNTCFFNSVLQNLLSLDQLRDHFLKEDLSGGGGPLVSSLKKLFVETKSEVGFFKSAINPIAFFASFCSQAPQFWGYQQHDSHELLRCLLDSLSIEESSLREKLSVSDSNDSSTHQKPTLIDSVFGGEISSTVSCLECGHSSKVIEQFLDLSLPVPSKKPPPRKQETISQEKIGNIPPNRCAKPETVLDKEDARATRSNEDTAVSRISADFNEAQVCGYPDLGKSSLSENMWADEELPLMVADSQLLHMPYKDGISYDDKTVADSQFLYMPYKDGISYDDKTVADSQFLYMPYKDGISYDDKTVAEGKGDDASSSYVSGHHEQTIDYVDFSSFWDEPEISQGPVFGPPSKAEVSEAGLMSVSSNDITVKAGVDDHGQNIDYADVSSYFNEPEVFEGHFGPASKAGFMSVMSDSDVEVLDDSDSAVSLDRSLAQFTKPEILSEENAWHCENCSKNLKLQRQREKILTKEGLGNGWVNVNEATLASDECRNNPLNHFDDGVLGDSDTKQSSTSSQPAKGNESEKSEDEAEDSKEVIVKTEATKRVLVNKAPSVLTIHLKRFSQDARGRLSKLSGHVDFKEFLDLSQYMDTRWTEEDQPVYRLVGLVEHKGTMRGGHYVSYIRDHKERSNSDIKEPPNSSIWYYASDYYVRRASFEEVLSSEAYILFYQRI